MSREETISKLELYLAQAVTTTDDELDISALDAFCGIVKNEPELSANAARMLAFKAQATSPKEALLALDAFEECMDTLGSNFHNEVNKFKVLNELIRLVSKKFLGDKTPKEIQDRILDILLVWTDKFPELSKIKEAYTMLRTQGVVHEPQKNVIKPVNKKSVDPTAKMMESDKLKRLLQSKNQKDIEAANLMIQNMVRDNDRRIQIQNRRLMDLQSANENAILLKEMLDEVGNPAEINEDTLSTLSEIFNNCVKLKPTVVRLAEESHESESFTTKIFETAELLNQVIDSYTTIIMNRRPKTQKPHNESLLDVGNAATTVQQPQKLNGMLSELDEIFASPNTPPIASSSNNSKIDDLLAPSINNSQTSNDKIMELIKNYKAPAVNDLLGNFDLQKKSAEVKDSSPEKQKQSSKVPLSELDTLVSGMMKSKLSAAVVNESQDDEVLVQTSTSHESDDDDHNLISENIENCSQQQQVEIVNEPPTIALKDIKIIIDEIEPNESEPPRTILDEKKGLKILVNFTKDRPAKDVNVIVITVVNQGSMAIENFQFDASVSKPCKLRILEASGRNLPGVKPFKQPTETINQVLLLMNPSQTPVNLIAIITYYTEGDDDPHKEAFEVKDIPFIN